MPQNSIDVNAETFERDVLQGSLETPVVVDFWASWCAPCKVLKPILEKLADEYDGKFILAKVDTDKNQQLAAQFGVRGIPNVKAFVGGKVVSEFNGAIPESSVRAFLEKLIPRPAEALRLRGRSEMDAGNWAEGEMKAREALALEPGYVEARLDLVDALLARSAYEEAESEMEKVHEREREARAEQYARRIELWKRSRNLPSIEDLERAVALTPKDMLIRVQLGERLIAAQRFPEAMDVLLDVIRSNRGELREEARKAIVHVFSLVADSELVDRYRRLLASALY